MLPQPFHTGEVVDNRYIHKRLESMQRGSGIVSLGSQRAGVPSQEIVLLDETLDI